MVQFKGRIWKTGSGFVITVPKAFVENNILKEGQEIVVEVVESGAIQE